jgi:hypothetical protein
VGDDHRSAMFHLDVGDLVKALLDSTKADAGALRLPSHFHGPTADDNEADDCKPAVDRGPGADPRTRTVRGADLPDSDDGPPSILIEMTVATDMSGFPVQTIIFWAF